MRPRLLLIAMGVALLALTACGKQEPSGLRSREITGTRRRPGGEDYGCGSAGQDGGRAWSH